MMTNADLLDELMVWAENQGVALTVFERDGDCWEIDSIVRHPDSDKGTGQAVLKRLIMEADQRGCMLMLTVTGGNSALEALYAALGFVPDGARDAETADLNMRRPTPPPELHHTRRPRPNG